MQTQLKLITIGISLARVSRLPEVRDASDRVSGPAEPAVVVDPQPQRQLH